MDGAIYQASTIGDPEVYRYKSEDGWVLMPTGIPQPDPIGEEALYSGPWAWSGQHGYGIMADRKLYRAAATSNDLIWSGPLAGGQQVAHIQSANINMTSDGARVYILQGKVNRLTTYDILEDTTADQIFDVGFEARWVSMCWDGDESLYLFFADAANTDNKFYRYNIHTAAIETLAHWINPTIPAFISCTKGDGYIFFSHNQGYTVTYVIDENAWGPLQSLMASGGNVWYVGDSTVVLWQKNNNGSISPNFASWDYGTGEDSPLPAFPDVGVVWSGGLYVDPNMQGEQVYPEYIPLNTEFPGGLTCTTVTLPKQVDTSDIPNSHGSMAPPSLYNPPTVEVTGKVFAYDSDELQELMDALMDLTHGTPTLEIWPGRFCDVTITQDTIDAKWHAEEKLIEYSFSAVVLSGFFYDGAGREFRTP